MPLSHVRTVGEMKVYETDRRGLMPFVVVDATGDVVAMAITRELAVNEAETIARKRAE